MSDSPGSTMGPTFNTLLVEAHELLDRAGITLSRPRVAKLVHRFDKQGNGRTLAQFLAGAIAEELNTDNRRCAATGFIVTPRKGRRPGDPTGNEAVRRADHPDTDTERTDDEMPEFATISEVAQRYGVSATTIRRYIAAGRITAHRMGPRLIRIDPEQAHRELFGGREPAA